MAEQKERAPFVKMGGLWEKVDKNNTIFYQGSMGDVNLFVMSNRFKKEESHPDYILYFSQKEKREGDQPRRQSRPVEPEPRRAPPPQQQQQQQFDDIVDLPF